MEREAAPGGWRDEIAFLRRVLIVAGVVVLLLFLWLVQDALLLVFAAVLIAVPVRALVELLQRRLGLDPRWGLLVACLSVGLPLILVFVLVGSEVRDQAGQLIEQLPAAAGTLERLTGLRLPLPSEGEVAPSGSAVGEAARHAASAAMVALDALGALVIAVVGGIYIAADPGRYRRGAARLLPRSQQARAEDAMSASGQALRQWMKAQALAMAAVGILTGLGAWAIGLPAPLALGLFAAIADIIPLVGPFIGAVPGLLLALNQDWETVAWAVLLYVVVQQIEGNVLMPMVSARMISVPPALMLFSVVAAGAVFGLAGVLLAAPLTVVAMVLVGKLYMRETLGRHVEVPGENEGKQEG
jgi:predicted PurR-regulated permease PerM